MSTEKARSRSRGIRYMASRSAGVLKDKFNREKNRLNYQRDDTLILRERCVCYHFQVLVGGHT